ncbi:MAG: tetratricopeptide repeat protein [Opitutaceae bacterium]
MRVLNFIWQRPVSRPWVIAGAIAAACFVSVSSLQAQPTSEDLEGRVKRLTTLLHSNQLVEARPMMISLRPEVPEAMQANLDFYMGLSYVFEYYEKTDASLLDTAIAKLEAFISANPNHALVTLSRYNVADSYAMQRNFEKALELYIPLYQNPSANIDSLELLKKIVLIYAAEQKWEAGIPYFRDSMRKAELKEDRTTSAAYLLIAQAKTGEIVDSSQLLEFFKSPAPVFYTPRFNAALMEVGDNLKEEGDLATASLFYQFVRDYETLETGLTAYIETLKMRVEEYAGNTLLRSYFVEATASLENAKSDLEALRSSANYTPLLNWRIASIHMDLGRNWEAFWRFRLMVDSYPDHEFAEDILFSAYSLGNQLGASGVASDLGKRYLDRGAYKKYRSTVVDQVSSLYMEEKRVDELYALSSWYLERAPDDEAARLLLYKHAVSRMSQLQNEELIRDFLVYQKKYDSNKCAVIIRYFLGLAYLLEQSNQQAVAFFDLVIADENTKFRADASFRKAQAVLGLDRIEESRDLLFEFIEKYPDNSLRAEAELTLGNILDLLGSVDDALTHYRLVEKYTDERELLAKAELKISRILIDRRQVDDAIQRLQAFMSQHGDYPESISVSSELATIYQDINQPRVALGVLKRAMDNFFEEIEIHDIDTLIVKYLQLDRDLREGKVATDELIGLVKNDPELLDELVNDRAKQYRFFRENDKIDALLHDSFVRDNDFRVAVIKDITVLDKLKSKIDKLNESLPLETADEFLTKAGKSAFANSDMALVVRVKTALAKVEEPELTPEPQLLRLLDDEEQWNQLGTAGKLWILDGHAATNPARVVAELEQSRTDFINTPSELNFHLLQARCYKSLDRVDESIAAYRTLIKRFAHAKESGEASLLIGQMEVLRNNAEAARVELESILHRNEWRGEKHAMALLWIGRSYAVEELYAEAHGFYERIILGYPAFSEMVAMAFYEDIRVLKLMGETESVQMVHEAFKMTPNMDDTEGAQLIRKEFE